MRVSSNLEPSVLSSSSARDLRSLFYDVGQVSSVRNFDLLVPRPCDLPMIHNRNKRLSWLMADHEMFTKISEDLIAQLQGQQVSVPALATFYPDVSSADKNRRKEAVSAVVNTFKLAKRLKDWMPVPVVEIVCGTIIEASSVDRVSVYGVSRKLDWLIDSLETIVARVSDDLDEFAIALELEPGEIYLLNDEKRIEKVFARCNASKISRLLNNHVGLNIDVAHMRIAGVSTSQLEPFIDRICHAHISDHPGIHTHDQFVGNWTNVEQREGGYSAYLRQLIRRFDSKSSLPYTGRIAIELEGCNRISWIYDSIARLKHAIHLASDRLVSETA